MKTELDKILERVPHNTHRWADYEFGKRILEYAGLYSSQALKMLADWVGV